METLDGLISGFEVAFSPVNLFYVTLGVLVGTVIGLLPGLGPVAAIALLLPLTFELHPATAIMMLAGIYYGSMYGGRIPAILLRLPGDASAVVTTFDGYPLTQQGKAGPALGITAIASFLGGSLAIVGLTVLAPILARFANKIGPPELFALTFLGLLMITSISSGSKAKSLAMAALGILLASIGLDPISGSTRLTGGSVNLMAGIGIVPLAVGIFGIGEIMFNAESRYHVTLSKTAVGRVLPSMADWVATRMAIARAAIIGFFIGIIPGGGGTVSSVLAYGVERRFSKHPEKFGKGAMDGLAATEAADNASSNSAFIPLLTLGVPPNPVLALIFGALLLHNVTPGPQLITEHPDIFWGVIASMYIGNIILLALNLPLIRVFIQLLRLRGSIMSPLIIIVAICGVYSVQNSMFDVGLAVVFGLLGYLLRKLEFDLGPLVLGFILGPILEVQFRRSMLISDGSFSIFLERPVSLIAAILIGGAVVVTVVAKMRAKYAWRKSVYI